MTACRFDSPVSYDQLIADITGGKIEGLRIEQNSDKDPVDKACGITDIDGCYGGGFLHISPSAACDTIKAGAYTNMSFGRCDPTEIIDVVAEYYGVGWLSEHDEGFFEDEDYDDDDDDDDGEEQYYRD